MKNLESILCFIINKICGFLFEKVLHKEISRGVEEKILQFVKFGIVGLSNTLISYVIYLIAFFLFQKGHLFPNTDYLIAQVIAFILSVLWSFYWNQRYVFESDLSKGKWVHALLKTYISYAFTGLFLNSILAVLWVQVLGISKVIAPIINLLISVPLNFILNKFWAFKE